jgi:hypothetical protein
LGDFFRHAGRFRTLRDHTMILLSIKTAPIKLNPFWKGFIPSLRRRWLNRLAIIGSLLIYLYC